MSCKSDTHDKMSKQISPIKMRASRIKALAVTKRKK